jgi:peptide/nickel transport system ATP-binding protein
MRTPSQSTLKSNINKNKIPTIGNVTSDDVDLKININDHDILEGNKSNEDTITIDVRNLKVSINGHSILRGEDFQLSENEVVGIVGESGSGKSIFVRSLMGLLPLGATPTGEYRIDGKDFPFTAKEKSWRKIRGSQIGMVMQDPFTALNPSEKCGKQVLGGVPKSERASFSIKEAFLEVGLSESIANRYPHQLSGGQRQRVVIAAALATKPRLLIADEATTALDVITQEEILNLIFNIRKKRSMPLILITHNILLAKQRTHRIFVMGAGSIVESGITTEVLANPKADETKDLLNANHFLHHAPYASGATKEKVVLCVQQLYKSFGNTKALEDVSIIVDAGECVGIVGESGSGKTTLGRSIVGLTRADSGGINYFGKGSPQMVFQDPYSSLNPAHTIRYILEEALLAAGQPKSKLAELIDLTEIAPHLLERKPHGLSGGQRQRIAIARALAPNPELIICDESVSALDVKVQNQILIMIEKLRKERDLAVLFITHDLSVLRMIASRVYVMHNGKIVEHAPTKDIFESAQNEYTRKLIEASKIC